MRIISMFLSCQRAVDLSSKHDRYVPMAWGAMIKKLCETFSFPRERNLVFFILITSKVYFKCPKTLMRLILHVTMMGFLLRLTVILNISNLTQMYIYIRG